MSKRVFDQMQRDFPVIFQNRFSNVETDVGGILEAALKQINLGKRAEASAFLKIYGFARSGKRLRASRFDLADHKNSAGPMISDQIDFSGSSPPPIPFQNFIAVAEISLGGRGFSLSPRGDLRMPSDADSSVWLADLPEYDG